MFSKSYCPFCIRTKNKLDDSGYKYRVFEVDHNEVSSNIVKEMQSKTGHRTFPSIYIGDQFVGGDSDLTNAIKNGKFEKLAQAQSISKA